MINFAYTTSFCQGTSMPVISFQFSFTKPASRHDCLTYSLIDRKTGQALNPALFYFFVTSKLLFLKF